VINDKNRSRLLSGFKLKPKLLLDSSEEGRARAVGSRCIVGGPLQLEIVAAGERSLVDDDASGNP
jgi:hypothetical protein